MAISVEIRRVESPVASGIRLGCTKSAISCAKRDSDRGKIAASDHIGISIVIKITNPREALANSITGSGTKSTVAISKQNRSVISADHQVRHAIAIQIRDRDGLRCFVGVIPDCRLESAVPITQGNLHSGDVRENEINISVTIKVRRSDVVAVSQHGSNGRLKSPIPVP